MSEPPASQPSADDERLELERRKVTIDEARLELEREAAGRRSLHPNIIALAVGLLAFFGGIFVSGTTLSTGDRATAVTRDALAVTAVSVSLDAATCGGAVRRARLISDALDSDEEEPEEAEEEQEEPELVVNVRELCTSGALKPR